MSRRVKSTLSAVLAVVTALVMLAGCASTVPTAAPTSAPANATEASTTEPTTAPTAAPTTAPATKMVMVQASWGKPTEDPSNARIKEAIDKALGIDIQLLIMPPTDGQTKFDLMLASDIQMDCVLGFMVDFQSGYNYGVIAKLDDLLQQYGQDILKNTPDDLWQISKAQKDGAIISVPDQALGEQSYFKVRADLLQKYGMEKPTTLDQFDAYLAKAKEAGVGCPLYYGATANLGWSSSIFKAMGGMYLTTGYSSLGFDASGNAVNIIRADGFKEMIAKIADWYAKGYVPADLVSWTADKKNTMLGQADFAAIISWASDGIYPFDQYYKDHPEAKIVYLDPLTGGTTGKNAGTQELGYNGGVWIPEKSSPEAKVASMKYMNWLLADINNWMIPYAGIKGTDWDWVDESTHSWKKIKNDLPVYEGNFYRFDCFGVQLRAQEPTPDLNLYYDMFDEYPIHAKLVPVNPFRFADRDGLFSQANKDNNAADLQTFVTEQLQKFMSGTRPMAEWDAFIQEYLDKGGQKLDDALAKVWNDNKANYPQ